MAETELKVFWLEYLSDNHYAAAIPWSGQPPASPNDHFYLELALGEPAYVYTFFIETLADRTAHVIAPQGATPAHRASAGQTLRFPAQDHYQLDATPALLELFYVLAPRRNPRLELLLEVPLASALTMRALLGELADEEVFQFAINQLPSTLNE